MNSAFLASFLSDVKKIREVRTRRAVAAAIANVEAADAIDEFRSLKRLSGQKNYYRVRIGDWRIGRRIEGQTAPFIRCLHRREIYRFFP